MDRQPLAARYQAGVDPVDLLEILCMYGQETVMPMHVFYTHCPQHVKQRHNIGSLKTLLENMYSRFFAVERGPMGTDIIRAQEHIVTKCEVHCSKEGFKTQHECDALHACMFFLRGSPCKIHDTGKMRCFHGHNLSTKHNASVLLNAQLQGISLEALQQLLRLNRARPGRTNEETARERRATSTGRTEHPRASRMGSDYTGRQQQTESHGQPTRRSGSCSCNSEQPQKTRGKDTSEQKQHAKYVAKWQSERDEGAARARRYSEDVQRADVEAPRNRPRGISTKTKDQEGQTKGARQGTQMGERKWWSEPKTQGDPTERMHDTNPEVPDIKRSSRRRTRNSKRTPTSPDSIKAVTAELEQPRAGRPKRPAQTTHTLKICHFYNFKGGCQYGDSGAKCQALHICKHYLTGDCIFGKECRRCHDIFDPQVKAILVRHGMNVKRSKSQVLTELQLIFKRGNEEGTGVGKGKGAGNGTDTVQKTPEESTHVFDQNELADILDDLLGGKKSETRQPARTLKVCRFYNFIGGCQYSESGEKCHALHICKHYLSGGCAYGDNCKRSHDVFASQPRAVLVRHGINMNRSKKLVLAELQLMYTESAGGDDKSDNSGVSGRSSDVVHRVTEGTSSAYYNEFSEDGESSSEDDDDDDDDINVCINNLSGNCAYGRSCLDYHCAQPYQWQYLDEGKPANQGPQWCDFSSSCNKEIELTYCDPSTTECFSQLENKSGTSSVFKVNFDGLVVEWNKKRRSEVRRLGTVSYAEAPKSQKFTTRWYWYWQNEHGKWRKYGQVPSDGVYSSVSSDDIEREYTKNSHGQITFSVGAAKYALDPNVMLQINLETGTKRRILNRPEYSDMATWTIKTSRSSKSKEKSKPSRELAGADTKYKPSRELPGADPKIPSNWDPDVYSDNPDYQIVLIEKTGKTAREYSDVEKLFMKTMPEDTSITDISRIQNYDLWQAFTCKRRRMERPGKSLHEKHLFHATQLELIEPICQQGFDWRLSGRSSGDLYGKGSYFARDAGYSKRFTTEGVMFLARTLVGDYTKGDQSFVRPPPKEPSRPDVNLYDSCVDVVTNPMIYVVFSHDQAYPEYLITFSLPTKKAKPRLKNKTHQMNR